MLPRSLNQVFFSCHYRKVAITGVFNPASVLLQPTQIIICLTDIAARSYNVPSDDWEENKHFNKIKKES